MKERSTADLIIFGNVITMDDRRPTAQAIAVKGDRIMYVGSAETAKKLCNENTEIHDFGNNSVYPGFLESHCHPAGAGFMMNGTASLDRNASFEECVKVIKEYIESNPEKQIYSAVGFGVGDGSVPDHSMLDSICSDKPIVCTDAGGHSMWLNKAAMEKFKIGREAAEKWGTDCVKTDEKGEPVGFISEAPVFHVRSLMTHTHDDIKRFLTYWQDHAVSKGYTGVYDAGVELISPYTAKAYHKLEEEGNLKLYTFAGSILKDNTDTPEKDIEKISEEALKHNSKHYRLIGAKIFCDGVLEGHTAWLLDDYLDQPGYKGNARFDDYNKMVRILKCAGEHGLNVHVHTIGDAAVKTWVDAIEEARKITGYSDMRNALAHMQIVRDEDFKRIAELNIIAAAGMMWVDKTPGYFEQSIGYIGKEKAYRTFPVRSFIDAGAVTVSHSDYPVSLSFSIPCAVCYGVLGYLPSQGKERLKNRNECISRKDALKALTTNVAYMWHEENSMGSLETGKLANISVFNRDFMKDDFTDIEKAECLATFIDGKSVFTAEQQTDKHIT